MSARDYVIKKATDIQTRASDVVSTASGVADDPRSSPGGSEARLAVTAMARDAYDRTREAGEYASQEIAKRMRAVSELANELATMSGELEDREAGKRIMSGISESVDRLKASYEEEIAEVRGHVNETIRGYAEKGLVARDAMRRRKDEVEKIGRFLKGATDELVERFMQEAERRGAKRVVERALGILEFDKEFTGRLGSVERYGRDLGAPVDALEVRLARLSSVPGFYEALESDLRDVYSHGELDDLYGRLEKLL